MGVLPSVLDSYAQRTLSATLDPLIDPNQEWRPDRTVVGVNKGPQTYWTALGCMKR
jgi:hypothetical protein